MPPEKDRPLPYYRWYWQSWRANRRVWRTLDHIQRGAYRELLDECWAEGFIVDDVAALAEVVGCSVEAMRAMWTPALRAMFVEVDGCPRHLVNRRLERERTEADTVRVKRAVSGSIGGRARHAKSERQMDLLASASDDQANESKCHIEGGEKEGSREGESRNIIAADAAALSSSRKKVVAAWNETAAANGYARVTEVAGQRLAKLNARIREPGWIDKAFAAIAFLGADEWYRDNPTSARFDVLIRTPGKANEYCERAGVVTTRKAASRGDARGDVDSAIVEDIRAGAGRLEADHDNAE